MGENLEGTFKFFMDGKEVGEVQNIEFNRPPLGIVPKYIWQDKRRSEIIQAICRYLNVNLPVPVEWIEEYNELTKKG